MMPINAGSLSELPFMDLTFRVKLARVTKSPSTGATIDQVSSWKLLPQVLSCDIMPLSDEVFYLQTGEENIATHVLHFFANTDVRPRDVVNVLSSARLAGPIGSWFDIQDRLEPTESIAFVRCHAQITDRPPSLQT